MAGFCEHGSSNELSSSMTEQIYMTIYIHRVLNENITYYSGTINLSLPLINYIANKTYGGGVLHAIK
jgi:hypothetical protein